MIEGSMTEIDAVARRSYGKLIAFLAARTRDVAEAEDALSEAFAKALEVWPRDGVPANPEAWLLTVARRRVIDMARRERRAESLEWLDHAVEEREIPDQRLALMFACAHPAIEAPIRAPLMLQVVLGLDAAMIASAFLMAPATMGQRLVRAKHKIREAGIPFRIPDLEELPDRLDTVLDAIYAAFGESWADATRDDLSGEALFLGRLVAELLPSEPEALGLLALMLHVNARRSARRTATAEYVPLAEQDTALWDAREIDEAEALLVRASTFGTIGRYQLEGAVQSAHVHRRRTGEDNWSDIVGLYDALYAMSESPVVALNRALAVAAVGDADAGLRIVRALGEDRRLVAYQPYWAALAELLARTRAGDEARHAYDIAIGLERDPAVREFLRRRQESVSP